MSHRETNQLSQHEADSSPDPSGQPEPTGWQGALCEAIPFAKHGAIATKGIARFFKFQDYRTTIRTEVIAGVTTFMTMAYILAVNPNILSNAIFWQQPQDLSGIFVLRFVMMALKIGG